MAGSPRTSIPKRLRAPSTTHVRDLISLLPYMFTDHSADDDFAVATLASLLNKTSDAEFFLNRSRTSPFSIFNNDTLFMEARNADGDWAGQDAGWTEGDMWAYTFDVVHDVPELIKRRGGNASFVAFLDQHFDGGTSIVPFFDSSH